MRKPLRGRVRTSCTVEFCSFFIGCCVIPNVPEIAAALIVCAIDRECCACAVCGVRLIHVPYCAYSDMTYMRIFLCNYGREENTATLSNVKDIVYTYIYV